MDGPSCHLGGVGRVDGRGAPRGRESWMAPSPPRGHDSPGASSAVVLETRTQTLRPGVGVTSHHQQGQHLTVYACQNEPYQGRAREPGLLLKVGQLLVKIWRNTN